MKVRFQADADLNQIILLAAIRQEPALDFQTEILAGLPGLDDIQVLERTAGEDRILITHDRKTMPKHFTEFIVKKSSPGLLVVPQHLSVAAAVEDLLLVWSATETEEWINRIGFLPL